MYIETAVEVQK